MWIVMRGIMRLARHFSTILVVASVVAVNTFLVWFALRAGTLRAGSFFRFFTAVAIVAFGVGPLGTVWMIYQSIRYERKPWLYSLFAFTPYVFLWYYFDRVRRRTSAERRPATFR